MNQSFRARKTFAESLPGRKPVAHSGLKVGNAWPFILEDEAQAHTLSPFCGLRDQAPAHAILDYVTSQLGGDGGEPRLIYQAKAEGGGQVSHFAARDDNVVLALKRDRFAFQARSTPRPIALPHQR